MHSHSANIDSHSCKGNVLFIILLAVALLGMLTAVVGQMTESDMSGPERERLGLKVNQVLEYASALKTGVDRVYLQNQRSESDIRFAHPELNSAYGDPAALDPEQMIFHPSGGGVEYKAAPVGVNDGSDWFFTGANCVPEMGTGRTAPCVTDNSHLDLIAILPNVTLEFCNAINKKIGVTASAPPQDNTTSYNALDFFSGSFSARYNIDGSGINGNRQLCYEGDTIPAAGTYHFYSVLLER